MSIFHEHQGSVCITHCRRCRYTQIHTGCHPHEPLTHCCRDDSGRVVMRYRRDGRYEYTVVLTAR